MGGGESSGAAPAVQQTGPFGIQGGLFGGSSFDQETGTVNNAMSAQAQNASNLGFAQSNQFGNAAFNDPGAMQQQAMGLNFMNQAGNTDPLALQGQLFGQQSAIMQPMFQQQQLDQEGRLFAQGRLGSTPGANQQQALMQSQNNTFGQMLNNAFGQSQAQQAQQMGFGQSLFNQGLQRQGTLQGMGAQGLQQALALQGAQDQSLQTAGQLTSSNVGGTAGTVSPMSAVGGGLLAGGAQGLGDAIGGLFQPQQTGMNFQNSGPSLFMGSGLNPGIGASSF